MIESGSWILEILVDCHCWPDPIESCIGANVLHATGLESLDPLAPYLPPKSSFKAMVSVPPRSRDLELELQGAWCYYNELQPPL